MLKDNGIFTNKSVPSANDLAANMTCLYLVFPSLDDLMTLQAHQLVRIVYVHKDIIDELNL